MATYHALHFRVDPALKARLEEYAAEAGMSTSQAARALIQLALGDHPNVAALSSASMEFHGVIRRAVGKLAHRFAEELPETIREELQDGV